MSPEKQVRGASYPKSRLWKLNLLLKKNFITGLLVMTPLWETYLILKAFLTLGRKVLGVPAMRYES